MPYQRSFEIERRLVSVLELILAGGHSTPQIAKKVGVSIPTVSRDVTALRERGHRIRAFRVQGIWQYTLVSASQGRRSEASMSVGVGT